MTKKAEKRTLWETQGRSFVRDLDYGKRGEERIARHLRKYKSVVDVRDISNTRRGIDDDIDFEILTQKSGLLCKNKGRPYHLPVRPYR